MSIGSLILLLISAIIFVGAASAAKSWALSANSAGWLAATLVLYTLGNLIMLKLIRDLGMSSALSLSAVVQLLAVNFIAIAVFGERISLVQASGVLLAAASILLITLGSSSR